MGRPRRTAVGVAGAREARAISATLGGQVREARHRRQMSLDELGRLVGLSDARLSEVERGLGASLPLGTWIRIGLAVARPLAVRLSQPVDAAALVDAGHLELQEWVLRIARGHGWDARLEVPTRASDPAYSIDVLVRAGDLILLLECWNTIRDFGAAIRSTQRKLAEAGDLAAALGASGVRACWLVRPSAANRSLVRRYPEAFRARFEGSHGWVQALRNAADHPATLGFVWLDPTVGVSALRIRS